MRITHQQATDSILSHLKRQTGRITKTQEIIASGKHINRPSDDPQGMARILDARQVLSSLEQYQRNIIQAELRTQTLETTLAAVDDFVESARGIAAGAGLDPQMNASLASEIGQIRDQVIQLANQRLGDNFLFAGHNTATAPFLNDGTYTGDSGSYRIRAGQTTEISLQVDGGTVFKATEDIFAILEDLQTALELNDISQVQSQIDHLTRFQEHLQVVRTEIGLAAAQLEVSNNYLDRFILNIEDNLADIEQANLTEAIMALQAHNIVYEAALAAAADLLQPSLLNFLR